MIRCKYDRRLLRWEQSKDWNRKVAEFRGQSYGYNKTWKPMHCEQKKELKSMNKSRNSNIELLRIISMALIVLCHYVYHGGLLYQNISINQILAQLLKIGGKLGVVCYVLISANYLLESKFKTRKVFIICGETSFYASLLIAVKFLTGGVSVLRSALNHCLHLFMGYTGSPQRILGCTSCFRL